MTSSSKSERSENNHSEVKNPKHYKWNIVWANVIKFTILHLIAVKGLFYYIFYSTLASKIFLFIFAEIMIMSITGCAHRLYSHRSYKAKLPLRYFLVCLQAGELQNNVLVWARDHRVHHKYTDTDADPHNSSRGFFFSHIGWLLLKKEDDVRTKGETIDVSDIANDEAVKFQLKYYYPLAFSVGFAFPTAILYFLCGESSLSMCFQMAITRYVISLHRIWFINSWAHTYGYTTYDKNISAKQNEALAIVSSGEGYHNFHHVFPWDYRSGEFCGDNHNFTTFFIDLMAKVGLVYQRRIASHELIKQRKNRTGHLNENPSKSELNGTSLWGVEDEDMPEKLVTECVGNIQ